MNQTGITYWITGLSGAGKTTVGKELYYYLRNKQMNLVFLDGDILREVFRSSDYSQEGRKELASQYARMCKMLNNQGLDVIICTISMFDDVRYWNRSNIINYREIYIKVDLEELIKRDQKGLYSGALSGEEKNVLGVNETIEEPKNPDLVINNFGDYTPKDSLNLIIQKWNL